MRTELVPCIDIADMYFHAGNANIVNGIMNGIAVVGISSRIDDYAVKRGACRMQLINDRSLVVGLEDLALQSQSSALLRIIRFRSANVVLP